MGWVHVHFSAPDLVGVLEGHSHASIASVKGSRREEISARWRDARLLASVNILPVDAPPVKHVGWITLSRLAICPEKAVNILTETACKCTKVQRVLQAQASKMKRGQLPERPRYRGRVPGHFTGFLKETPL